MKRFLFLVVTLFFVLCLPQQAEAADDKGLKAFSWNTKDKFEDLLKEHYGSYGAKFDFDNPELYVKGQKKPINLNQMVYPEGKAQEDAKSTPKYYFWVKSNNLASNGIHWSTEYFMGTLKPVGEGEKSSSYTGVGGIKIDRLVAKEDKNSFFKSEGKAVPMKGDSGTADYGLTLYVVDVEDFVDEYWQSGEFSEKVYLQTVARTYNGGTPTSGYLMSMEEWIEATTGWGSCSFDEYVTHYNQWLEIENSKESDVYFYYRRASSTDPWGERYFHILLCR